MTNKSKIKFSKPDPTLVAGGTMSRTWRVICPICREEFFTYKHLNADEGQYPDGYLAPLNNTLDESGMYKFRDTCGDFTCHNAEESHGLSVSSFNKVVVVPDAPINMPKRPKPKLGPLNPSIFE